MAQNKGFKKNLKKGSEKMGKRGPKPGTGGRPKQTIVDNKTALSIYNNTIEWLKGLNCYEDVPNHLIEEYALCKARWLECELEIQRSGLTAEHPTTKKPTKSFYTEISMNYLKQADIAYNAIVEIIRLKSPLSAAVKDIDPMENLLNETKV